MSKWIFRSICILLFFVICFHWMHYQSYVILSHVLEQSPSALDVLSQPFTHFFYNIWGGQVWFNIKNTHHCIRLHPIRFASMLHYQKWNCRCGISFPWNTSCYSSFQTMGHLLVWVLSWLALPLLTLYGLFFYMDQNALPPPSTHTHTN